MSWTKILVKTHNYLGLGLSLIFLALFGSGIIMMFAGYPRYYDTQRLPDLPSLGNAAVNVSVERAYVDAGLSSALRSIRLNVLQGRPVFRFEGLDGSYGTVFADNGEVLSGVDSVRARQTVEWFTSVNRIEADVRPLGLMENVDAWTTNPGFSGTPHWPFYKFELGDSSDTHLYVSSETAEVVHKTTFWQRIWGYLGSVIHYFYIPTEIRQFPSYWFAVVVFISGLGSVLCLLGVVVGAIFFRWQELGKRVWQWLAGDALGSTRAVVPFNGWMYWHHYLGMLFGVIAFTWIFSGMMSMNPLGWRTAVPDETAVSRWTGGSLSIAGLPASFRDALSVCQREIDVKEIRLLQLAGEPYFYCLESSARTRLVFDLENVSVNDQLPADLLKRHARTLMSGWSILEYRWLEDYDAYYQLGRPERLGYQVKRLPVLRVKVDDPSQSWLYIDPYSGSLSYHFQSEARLNRWLFDGLHTFDFSWLHEDRRALWWVLMFSLMIGGLGLSVTSVWLTLRWFWRKAAYVSRRASQNL